MFGENADPDIDVYQIFKDIKPGNYAHIGLCEGCGMDSIGNDGDGKLIYHTVFNEEWFDYRTEYHFNRQEIK